MTGICMTFVLHYIIYFDIIWVLDGTITIYTNVTCSQILWDYDCWICMTLFPVNCPPPLTPHNGILCWRERIIFVTVELLERKFNFLPIITQYKCYPWPVSQGLFIRLWQYQKNTRHPSRHGGNFIHIIGKLIESVANTESNIINIP